jgi:hypothetical protein
VTGGEEVWSPWLYRNGIFEPLKVPPGRLTQPTGIVRDGDVVGTLEANGVKHGFRTIAGRPMIFNMPVARETSINGANERGQITGCNVNRTGKHGDPVTAVDPPSVDCAVVE